MFIDPPPTTAPHLLGRKENACYWACGETNFATLSGQVPMNAVNPMGRRNTKLETACTENKSQNCSLRLDQPERCSGWVLTEYSQTDASPAQAMSNQRTGWCSIDRLSWQPLAEW
jgi:hypothetical protein